MALTAKNLQYRKTLSDIGEKLTDSNMRSIRFICKAVNGLTKRDLEEEEPLEFFEKLEERGVLSYDDTNFLKELLGMVHRMDCMALLQQYEGGESLNTEYREPVQAMDHNVYHGMGHNGYHGMGHNGYQGISQSVESTDSAFVSQGSGQLPVQRNRGMVQQVTESSSGEDLSDVFDLVVEEIGRDWRQLARKLHLTEIEIERISEDHMRNLREQSMQCLVLWKKKMRYQATKSALVEALKKCRMMYIADIVEGCQFR